MVHRTPLPPASLGCHRTGFEKKCRDLVAGETCDRWRSKIVMEDGKTFPAFDCVDNWAAVAQESTVREVAGLYSIVESVRNEFMALAGFKNGHPDALILGTRFGQPTNGAQQITDQTE